MDDWPSEKKREEEAKEKNGRSFFFGFPLFGWSCRPSDQLASQPNNWGAKWILNWFACVRRRLRRPFLCVRLVNVCALAVSLVGAAAATAAESKVRQRQQREKKSYQQRRHSSLTGCRLQSERTGARNRSSSSNRFGCHQQKQQPVEASRRRRRQLPAGVL